MAIIEDPEAHEVAALARLVPSFAGLHVLEIGCGDGRLTRRYAPAAASVIAIDPTAESIARLKAEQPAVDARALGIDALVLPPTASMSPSSRGPCDESPREGMVHALRRAHRWVKPSGFVVDIHPTADLAVLLAADIPAGVVESEAGAARHQAATDAIAAASDEGWFVVEGASEFDFDTYGGTVEELRDFILSNWRDTAIPEETIDRLRAGLAPGTPPRVRERVAICRLVPRPSRPAAA